MAREAAHGHAPAWGARAMTLRPPGALAPGSAPTDALTLPGGWHVEGIPDIVRLAGPRAAERLVEFFTAQVRNAYSAGG